jgi:3D-(3,5/4)-trihydroxycyclohexane-1,2-dione acylhydrolase (decyclizing)
MEYAFSCMGYEIAAGLGVARADSSRTPVVMMGDGSYLMMHTELVTAVAERLKFIVVLVQNHGYASIGHLSEDIGSQRFGTKYRFRDAKSNNHESGDVLPVDLATNAESLGMNVIRIAESPSAIADLSAAMKVAKAHPTATLIHINSDPLLYAPGGEAWWEVPIPDVSTLESTKKAYENYKEARKVQKKYLGKGYLDTPQKDAKYSVMAYLHLKNNVVLTHSMSQNKYAAQLVPNAISNAYLIKINNDPKNTKCMNLTP